MRANETYSEAKRQFSDRNRDVLMNVQSPDKWWSYLKSAVFGTISSFPPLVGVAGGLVSLYVLLPEADHLSDYFDSKQSRESVGLLLTCQQSSILLTFAFRSSEVTRLMLNLDPYGGIDPLVMVSLFL